MSRRVGIVMTCFNREVHLAKTLSSIDTTHSDYHIVVVHDGCDTPLIPSDIDIMTIWTQSHEKTWVNPVIPINKGIHHLLDNYDPDVLIFQNGECYHVGDIISYAVNHITDKNYISFGCFSVHKDDTHRDLSTVMKANDRGATNQLSSAWFNHPVFRPVGYDFCSAVSKANMIKLNGLDERFKDAMGAADVDLVRRVKLLRLDFEITEAPFVVHQSHSKHYRRKIPTNRSLYEKIKLEKNYRAVHVVTKDFDAQ